MDCLKIGDLPESGDEEKEKASEDDKTFKLAGKFAPNVLKLKVNLVEVMPLLLTKKQSPRQACDHVDAWVEKPRDKKRSKSPAENIFLGAQ